MRVITPNTRIAELIRANGQSIGAIAALSKPLQKLKNPLLRKVLASRVTISEAAKIGGCKLSDFKRVLEPLGFSLSLETNENLQSLSQTAASEKPVWLDKAKCTHLDVRQAIEEGNDPLREINEQYRKLPTGRILCIINTFIPSPLITLLEKKGAKTFVEQVDEHEYHTYFLKERPMGKQVQETPISTLSWEDFQTLLQQYQELNIIQLDVRDLPMPQPMERILNTLPELDNGKVLYVGHRRVPLHLLEEMENYDFVVKLCGMSDGDVRLLIHRK
ncbi:DUF2249 domain-containing protein [Sphingobacterium phlebotomi]|uniref:DUF2249 domain-containing protein n=1 Tax=Sphingobacterium phlebotomi TaxID=2605433 RepID=A0A5D4H402_9SPHI|nr:DUF2249 domain-containing protein [Sphingobacterium phlebotomi]TYR34749.1 DUF2249 domain-containing protein [Sphingobacterium phlebotomi]